MPGGLREQQRQQRHLLAKMRTAAYAESVQHLFAHFPDARHLERKPKHVISPRLNLSAFNNIKTQDYIQTSCYTFSLAVHIFHCAYGLV